MSTIDGVEFVRCPRIVWFSCPRGCGVVEWREQDPDNFCRPGVSLQASDDAFAEWDARPRDRRHDWPTGWAGALDHPACPRCGAKPGEGQTNGVYTIESVGGAGEKWRARR